MLPFCDTQFERTIVVPLNIHKKEKIQDVVIKLRNYSRGPRIIVILLHENKNNL